MLAKYRNTYPATVVLSLERFDWRTQEPASFHITVMGIAVSLCLVLDNGTLYRRNFVKYTSNSNSSNANCKLICLGLWLWELLHISLTLQMKLNSHTTCMQDYIPVLTQGVTYPRCISVCRTDMKEHNVKANPLHVSQVTRSNGATRNWNRKL